MKLDLIGMDLSKPDALALPDDKNPAHIEKPEDTIAELFSVDPETLEDADIERLVSYFRKARVEFLSEERKGGKGSTTGKSLAKIVKPKKQISLASLGLEDIA